jgi:hypothetical protein
MSTNFDPRANYELTKQQVVPSAYLITMPLVVVNPFV